MDFKKYKNALKQYLKAKGFNPSGSVMFCFSPHHSNTNTPACMINDHNFNCASCGVHGDVYDACGILTGETDRIKQFLEVEKTILGYNPEWKKETKKKKKFEIDFDCEQRLINYLRKNGGRKKGVDAFLKKRGYSETMIKKIAPYLGYWPGFDIALSELGKETLKGAGVPLIHPIKNYSSWSPAGVVVRLSKGLKLCFYKNDKCEKRGTKTCRTFPGPWKIDKEKPLILVEAELSAISMRALDYQNVIPTGGTSGLTIKAIKEYLLSTKEITFAFDGDESGRKSTGLEEFKKDDGKKNYPDILIGNNYKGVIRIAQLPDGKDPDDLIQEKKYDQLQKIISDASIYKKKKTEVMVQKNYHPFFFLGFDERYYYVLPKRFFIPLSINRGDSSIKNMMKEVAPFEWWFNSFQKYDADGNASFDMLGAIEWFREESARKGLYDDRKVLGIGAYKDGENIVFNKGDSLFVEGRKIKYEDYEGEKIFTRSKIKLNFSGTPWTVDDGTNFINQLNTFNFEKKIDYIVVSGYAVISWLASLLDKRPHIWITAKSKTGKSTLVENLLVPVVGKEQAFYIESIASEAFFRQSCRKDCRVPFLDEFEAHNKEEALQQKKYFHFMRSAYSGIVTGKGTPGHEPITFNIKLMFCLISVNVRFDNEADSSRFVICRMKPKTDKKFMKQIENPNGLRLRTLKKISKIKNYIKKAKQLIIDNGYDYRKADTYSPFLVGFWMLVSDNDFFIGDDWLKKIIIGSIQNLSEPDYKDDEDRILERIFQERIKIDPGHEETIAEMLIEKIMDTSSGDEVLKYDSIIRRYGLRRFDYKGKEALAIEKENPALKRILSDTAFQDYKEILQRHPAIIDISQVVRMAGKTTRCMLFSWEKLEKQYFMEKNEENLQI